MLPPVGWALLISMAFKSEKKKGFFLYAQRRDEFKLWRDYRGFQAVALWGVNVPGKDSILTKAASY